MKEKTACCNQDVIWLTCEGCEVSDETHEFGYCAYCHADYGNCGRV